MAQCTMRIRSMGIIVNYEHPCVPTIKKAQISSIHWNFAQTQVDYHIKNMGSNILTKLGTFLKPIVTPSTITSSQLFTHMDFSGFCVVRHGPYMKFHMDDHFCDTSLCMAFLILTHLQLASFLS